jgi:hypothetical protein
MISKIEHGNSTIDVLAVRSGQARRQDIGKWVLTGIAL